MKNKIKSCIDCINYHEEPVQGGHVPVCVAKKGEFYGSYVVKNQNDVCEKYCTPYMKRKKAKQPTLDECIKEWKENGWTWVINEEKVLHLWKKDMYSITNHITYDLKDKELEFNFSRISVELLERLSKTLKAVEVDDE